MIDTSANHCRSDVWFECACIGNHLHATGCKWVLDDAADSPWLAAGVIVIDQICVRCRCAWLLRFLVMYNLMTRQRCG
jgi:hypothetical protein